MMSDQKQHKTGNQASKAPNQGEGDVASARKFNNDAKAFINSPRGREAIEHAGDVTAEELPELEQAEEAGLERIADEDPAVTRAHRKDSDSATTTPARKP